MPPEGEEGQEAGLSGLTRILRMSRPEWGWLVVGCVFLLLSLVPMLVLPLYFGFVVDDIQNPALTREEKEHKVTWQLTQLLVIQFVGGFASFVRALIFNGAGERVVSRLRIRLFESIVTQEIGMFDRRKTGELISRLTSDTTSLQDVATANVSMFLRGTTQIIVSAGLMFYNSWQLAAVILCVMPFCVIAAACYSPILRRLSTKYTDALGVSNDVAQETIANIRTVRSFAAERLEHQKYKSAIGDPDDAADSRFCWFPRQDSAYRAGMKKQVASALFLSFVSILFTVAIIIVLWFGAFQVIDGTLSFGNLSSFILYSVQIAASIGTMVGLVTSLYSAMGASKRAFQLIERQPLVPVSGGLTPAEGMQGVISFKDVCFSYPTRPEVVVMDNFTLDIPKNATVAFVGSSGAGKSTVLSLIQRFYDVTSGTILLDGRPLTELDPSWVRRQFAFVQQEPVLFGASVAANIGYGFSPEHPEQQPSQERLEAAAKDAFCHDFIMGFPEGYQTMVGERGVRLSGGQKQRVAIARALFMNPRVLLLDEATSALDAESEAKVQRAIDSAMVGRTTLIVAHRLSTVKRADEIVLVEKGKLVDKGTHENLLHSCTKYRELVQRQLAAGAVDFMADPAKEDTKEEAPAAGAPPAESKPTGKGSGSDAGKGSGRRNGGKGGTDPDSLNAPLLEA